jgi:beta-lactam-binding protein with PASTA domain
VTPPGAEAGATRRRFLPYAMAAIGGFGLAWLVVYGFVFPPGGPPVIAAVPNVLGLTYDQAAMQLKTSGFSAARGAAQYNVSAPRATVLAQSPASGTAEPKGSVVVLDVSAGQRRATVPYVVGLLRTQAESTLASVGLDVSNVTPRINARARGTVLATAPQSGTSMILPSGVDLIVSAGPDTMATRDSTQPPDGGAR